jgi:hypothetical protein
MNSAAVAALVDRYCLGWSDPDPARRRALLAEVLVPTATYTDPRVHADSLEALAAHIDRVLAQRPGARVLRTSEVDLHHGVARFAWHVVQADGTALPEGLDVVWLTDDGARLARILGFFGLLQRLAGSDG